MDAQLNLLLDIFIAIVLTGVVGFEREKAKKPAGFRTNMIIGGVSCYIVGISNTLITVMTSHIGETAIRTDPLRIVEAIIVGVSFIGAGTILKSTDEEKVTNLTTAATLLFSATIGLSIGIKQYILGVGLVVLTVVINYLIGALESKAIK